MSPAWRRILALAAQGAVLIFLGVICWASIPVLELTSETRATATDIPLSWVYMAAPIGCICIAIESLRHMAQSWRELTGGEPS